MNALLFYVTPTFRLTGSTINAIEYFLAVVEHNTDFRLILLNGNTPFKIKILKLMHERYVGIDANYLFKHNIKCINKSALPSKKFDTVLVLDYMTIAKTKGLINSKKLLVISEKYTEQEIYFYKKDLYNVEYYGEMPFHYRDHEYRMKCLFDKYKTLGKVKEGTYVNSPKNEGILYDIVQSDDLINLPTPIIVKSKTKPEENLFEQFTHYLYYHANRWFDPHPRLFLECAFYDKKIIYHNLFDIRDGSWYRYKDIKENGIKNRTLNKKDEIVCQLI